MKGGIIVMPDSNALKMINRVKAQLKQLAHVPEGIEVVTTYDRSELINASVDNLSSKLIEEMAFVAVILSSCCMPARRLSPLSVYRYRR